MTEQTIINDPSSPSSSGPSAIETNLAESSKKKGLLDPAVVVKALKCKNVVNMCFRVEEDFVFDDVPSKPSTRGTLALGGPVLKGGYRNQYMRFVSLVAKALEEGLDLLLPSIKWHDKKKSPNGVPFELLWDLDHWNAHPHLPKLVPFDESKHIQWNPNTTTFHGLCPTVLKWFQFPHRTSTYNPVKNSTHPFVFGGDAPGGRGNLWDYYRNRDVGKRSIRLFNDTSIRLEQLEGWVLQAMRPSVLVQSLVDDIRPNRNSSSFGGYLALHPRVEPEMIYHGHCEDKKQRNLTKIFDWVTSYPAFHDYEQLFIALDMPQMLQDFPRKFGHFQDHQHNLEAIQRALKDGYIRHSTAAAEDGSSSRGGSSSPKHIWMAGEQALEERGVDSCMIYLLASVVNLELAVQAGVFLGTAVSTWSTSVWKIRHALGKPNYEFTPKKGVQKVEGMPEPFNC